jgi:UDP-N-acetylmuramate dehydrogenase
MANIKKIVAKCKKEINCVLDVRYNESLCEHTTFKVGGPADCWLKAQGENTGAFFACLAENARAAEIPVFILGGGANIVVSDRGIRGIVFDTGAWKERPIVNGEGIIYKSGTSVDEAVEYAASSSLSGLEFLAGMPGSIGGSVWMNARCYEREIADVLLWTEVIDFSGGKPQLKKIITNTEDFGYKRSPFQGKDNFILSACFKLKAGNKKDIKNEMDKNRKDRETKGHYLFPCAGSVFRNNRDFGKSAGKIIDELGLRGLQIGGAKIAPYHGNIIINSGGAKASEIRALLDEIAAKVKSATGFILEPEIIFAGEWPNTL